MNNTPTWTKIDQRDFSAFLSMHNRLDGGRARFHTYIESGECRTQYWNGTTNSPIPMIESRISVATGARTFWQRG